MKNSETDGKIIKYRPTKYFDETLHRNGLIQCITSMIAYRGKSLEELRHKDYLENKSAESKQINGENACLSRLNNKQLVLKDFGSRATSSKLNSFY